ncbi:MAG: hypothetical protein QNJ74_09040 [Trichodesmium sp. MO_231.B1]|nr:hypothetical protein [Trichodesmium sp. MO_231.B1]
MKDNSETERKKFLEAIEKAFGNYLQNKISDWYKKEGDPILKDAFLRLANSASMYLPSYVQITDKITQILLEDSPAVNLVATPNSPNVSSNVNVSGIRHGNISDVKGIGGGIAGSVVGVLGGSYIGGLASIGLTALLPHIGTGLLLTGFLAPVGLLAILGGIWGAREARKDHYISEVKRKLKEEIPKIATEKARSIYSNVSDGFRDSLKIIQQMDDDITSQKEQLNNLLEQKRKNHIDTESEKKRLADLENTVTNLSQQAVRFYNQF